jgi:hypothetical protein
MRSFGVPEGRRKPLVEGQTLDQKNRQFLAKPAGDLVLFFRKLDKLDPHFSWATRDLDFGARAYCMWIESMALAHPPPIARRETGVLPNALCGGGQEWGVARIAEIIECAIARLSPRTARPPSSVLPCTDRRHP